MSPIEIDPVYQAEIDGEELVFDDDPTQVVNSPLLNLRLLMVEEPEARMAVMNPSDETSTPCLDIRLVQSAPMELDLSGTNVTLTATAVDNVGRHTKLEIGFVVAVNMTLDADVPMHRLMLVPRPSKANVDMATLTSFISACQMNWRTWYREVTEMRLSPPDGADGSEFTLTNANQSFQAAFEASERVTVVQRRGPPPLPK